MQFPYSLPGLKWLTVLWGVFIVFWAVLEGGLAMTVVVAAFTAVLIGVYLFNRILRGRVMATGIGLLFTAVSGALLGVGTWLLTLIFMAVKTGLHAHGPEFSAAEVNWVLGQLPLWTAAGLLGGLGLGLLLMAGSTKPHDPD